MILIVPRLRQDFRAFAQPTVSDSRAGPPARNIPRSPGGIPQSATALATSTLTPGPMVEESEIFFR